MTLAALSVALLVAAGPAIYLATSEVEHEEKAARFARQVNGMWSHWKRCSVTCRGGTQWRTCTGGGRCGGEKTQNRRCNEQPCPEDGNWSPWADSTVCSGRCGYGTYTRTRACDNPPVSQGGFTCRGNSTKVLTCYDSHCPVDGGWSDWVDNFRCSVTCGEGTNTKSRTCTKPTPLNGGAQCPGLPKEVYLCYRQACYGDGDWTDWGEWSTCHKTCGKDNHRRVRACDNPPPMPGGKYCKGSSVENADCNLPPCPVDGNWRPWTHWSECSVTCGKGGRQNRERTCTDPAPVGSGKDCPGIGTESKYCDKGFCVENGNWASWLAWSACSKTYCGAGTQERIRTCTDPAPKYGGICDGNEKDVKKCYIPCPEDGKWNPWSAWSICSTTCDEGTQKRTRTCSKPSHGGKTCVGNATEIGTCIIVHCPACLHGNLSGKGTHCYWQTADAMRYNDAVYECQKHQGILAEPKTPSSCREMFNFILHQLMNKMSISVSDHWIGIHDSETTGEQWYWQNNSQELSPRQTHFTCWRITQKADLRHISRNQKNCVKYHVERGRGALSHGKPYPCHNKLFGLCQSTLVCPGNEWLCPFEKKRPERKCLRRSWLCDGHFDCESKLDEENCDNQNTTNTESTNSLATTLAWLIPIILIIITSGCLLGYFYLKKKQEEDAANADKIRKNEEKTRRRTIRSLFTGRRRTIRTLFRGIKKKIRFRRKKGSEAPNVHMLLAPSRGVTILEREFERMRRNTLGLSTRDLDEASELSSNSMRSSESSESVVISDLSA